MSSSRSPGRRSRRASPPPATSPGTDEPIDGTLSLSDFARRADGRPHRAQGPARRRAAQVRLRRQYEPPPDPEDRGHARRRHRLAARDVALGHRPARRRAAGFERFALKAQTSVVGGNIAFSKVNLELDGNVRRRRADLCRGRPPDACRARSPSKALNLTPYMSAVPAPQRASGMEPRTDRSSTGLTASTSTCGFRRPASRSPMPSSGAPRSPPICATAISRVTIGESHALRRRDQGIACAREVDRRRQSAGAAATHRRHARSDAGRACRRAQHRRPGQSRHIGQRQRRQRLRPDQGAQWHGHA